MKKASVVWIGILAVLLMGAGPKDATVRAVIKDVDSFSKTLAEKLNTQSMTEAEIFMQQKGPGIKSEWSKVKNVPNTQLSPEVQQEVGQHLQDDAFAVGQAIRKAEDGDKAMTSRCAQLLQKYGDLFR